MIHNVTPDENNMKTKVQKLELFRSVFRGRTDVVPRYWESRKGGRGYSPICSNERREGFCQKLHGRSCSDCDNSDYVSLSDDLLSAHLQGEHVLGTYPLLPDETCHFVVADLDNHDGERDPLTDVKRISEVCEREGIPVYALRSRSGKGYHVYLFLKGAISARKARMGAFALLREAQVVGENASVSSFDRLFPNQDTHTGRGLGNLIGLPFQGEAAKNGHTIFLDPATGYERPFDDQRSVLETVQRIPEAHIDALVERWNLNLRQNNHVGVGGSTNSRALDPEKILAGVPEGQRETTLFLYACQCRGLGYRRVEVEALVKVAAKNCSPPFPEDEALKRVDSAWRYENGTSAEMDEKLSTAVREYLERIPDGLDKMDLLNRIRTAIVVLVHDLVSIEGLLALAKKRFVLTREEVAALRRWAKEEHKRKTNQRHESDKSPDEFEDARIVHRAIDFKDGRVFLGFRRRVVVDRRPKNIVVVLYEKTPGEWVVVNDEETIKINEDIYVFDPQSTPTFLEDRWSVGRLWAFVDSPNAPSGAELFDAVVVAIETYVDLEPRGVYYMLAAWITGTYLTHAFTSFPFLLFFGPKEAGKSRTLEVLSFLAFNALKLKDITVPALGDTVEGQRGAVLIDQAEDLPKSLVGNLADSYKREGGRRRVVERTKSGERTVVEFMTYGPKAFATTKDVDADLRDRCVNVPMIRTSKRLPDAEGHEPIWLDIRDLLYRWALLSHTQVAERYKSLPPTGTRWGELWKPLDAVFSALGISDDIKMAAQDAFTAGTKSTRAELPQTDEALFSAIWDLLDLNGRLDEPQDLYLTDLLADVRRRLTDVVTEDFLPSTEKWVSRRIKKYNLGERLGRRRKPGDASDKKRTVYQFKVDHVDRLLKTYVRDFFDEMDPKTKCQRDPQEKYHNENSELLGSLSEEEPTAPNVTHPGHQLSLDGGSF